MPDAPTDLSLPATGDVLAGKYRVERLLGQGGMGAVFAASHELLRQRVAIKVILGERARDPASVARFLNEARAMARIQDEHVARVTDVGTLENGAAFMVLEYLDGMDLSDAIGARGPLPVAEAIDYVVQALAALRQAHGLGIVHRDLKPSNLFLARRPDGSTCVKLLDFGISKAAGPLDAPGGAITTTGAIMGSPMYMSPEQLRNSKDVDARTDLWSLGVVLYELLAGRPPFGGETVGEVLASVIEAEIPPLQDRPDVPPALEAIFARCLAKKASERVASAAELAAALRPFASPSTLATLERVCESSSVPGSGQATQALPMKARPSSPATGASWAPPTGVAAPKSKEERGRRLAVAGGIASLAAAMMLGLLLGRGGGARVTASSIPPASAEP
ncbi:MAG TPA: serine/threonine-protein kinase, partial [Polyangiaceae bacterium]